MGTKTTKATQVKMNDTLSLSTSVRILLSKLLPKAGNYDDLIAIKKLQKKLPFTPVELKEFGIKTDKATGRISWNAKGTAKVHKIEFSKGEKTVIKKIVMGLDKAEKMPMEFIELYEQLK